MNKIERQSNPGLTEEGKENKSTSIEEMPEVVEKNKAIQELVDMALENEEPYKKAVDEAVGDKMRAIIKVREVLNVDFSDYLDECRNSENKLIKDGRIELMAAKKIVEELMEEGSKKEVEKKEIPKDGKVKDIEEAIEILLEAPTGGEVVMDGIIDNDIKREIMDRMREAGIKVKVRIPASGNPNKVEYHIKVVD